MTNEEISLQTKLNLAKALKQKMEYLALDKIKVSHLTKECDITRSTFYYHFTDIYDLLEWTFDIETVSLLKRGKDIHTWDEGVVLFLEYLRDNEKIFISAYNSMGRVLMEKFIFKKARSIMADFIKSLDSNQDIKKAYLDFIIDFYTSAYISLALNWFLEGMKTEPREVIRLIDATIKGDIEEALKRAKKNS